MPFRKRTNTYWDKRSAEQLSFVEKQALPYLKQIQRAYAGAQSYTLDEVKKLYLAYYTKEGFDTATLRQLAPAGDTRRFREAVRAAGLSDRLPDGYGFRLSRLELIEANIWLESSKAIKAHEALQTTAHKQTIKTGYNYAAYNLSKGTGVVPAFSQINTRAVNRILSTNFKGKNYSTRVWANGNKLARGLKQELAQAVATGQSQSKTSRAIREKYGVTRFEANRLVQTETNYFNTRATSENYQSVGLDEFVFVATLDTRTSNICQSHDGKRYSLENLDVQPPLHPYCRSTIRAYLGDEYEPDERIMRDPETGKNRYVSNISYDQWRELYL